MLQPSSKALSRGVVTRRSEEIRSPAAQAPARTCTRVSSGDSMLSV